MDQKFSTNAISSDKPIDGSSSPFPENVADKKSILLVDSETLLRESLKFMIESTGKYIVVGEADTAESALKLLDQLQPDILILDVALPGPSGIELLREALRRRPTLLSVFVSQHHAAQTVEIARSAGARGFVTKCAHQEELFEALSEVIQNREYFSPLLQRRAPTIDPPIPTDTDGSTDPLEMLSPREREIFHLLASGLQNANIAKKLFISPRTVETHRARVVRKLGLHTNAELIRFAIRHGLSVV